MGSFGVFFSHNENPELAMYSRSHLPFVLTLHFPYLPMFSGYLVFPIPVFCVKIASSNHHKSTFVYPIGDFTQTFIEIFPYGWILFRDYQGRSVSNK